MAAYTNGYEGYVAVDAAWKLGEQGGYEAASLPNWGGQVNIELRWLARQLGQARDADVCMDAFVRYEAALDETATAGIQLYGTHLRKTTADAYTLLVEALASERYAMLIEYLESFVATGPTGKMKSDFGSLRISDCADEYIHRTLRKILRHCNCISEKNSEARQLHLREFYCTAVAQIAYQGETSSLLTRFLWRR